MSFDELRQTFLAEAAETLRTADTLIARQAAEPNGASLAEDIRRSLHTVKGTCGFLGLPRLELLAHAVEECLTPNGRCRSAAEQALIRAALDRMDRIIGRIDALSGVEPPGGDGEVLRALEEISGRVALDLAGLGADHAQRVSWDGEPLAAADQPGLAAAKDAYLALAERLPDEHAKKTLARLAEIAGRLPGEASAAGMQPIGEVWPLLARAAGELAASAGKQVYFSTEGGDIQVDREITQRLFQPMLQLVRNAIAHGIEPPETRRRGGKPVAGRIRLAARQIGSRLIIDIADDGAGIDPTAGDAIFAPGLTTQPNATRLAGRGIGLDIVRRRVEEIDGLIGVLSEPGKGTTFSLDVPIGAAGEGLPMKRRAAAAPAAEVQPLAAAALGTWR